ncbi:MAG: trehalase family glycosidase [bacterium]
MSPAAAHGSGAGAFPEELWASAAGVLEENWTGTATLPSTAQYPHQWSWDSAFIGIGLARVRPERARLELTSLFRGQWASGRVPQIVYNPAARRRSYFPDAHFWATESLSDGPSVPTAGLVQPPLHARAVLSIVEADPGLAADAFLEDLYPKLVTWHRYLHTARTASGSPLVSIVHPWESGLDNSPAWDDFIAAAGPFDPERFVRRDASHVAAGQRPIDDDYRAYVALAERYRAEGCTDDLTRQPFVVEDPLFNAVFLDAERCLARIAGRVRPDQAVAHEAAARRLHRGLVDRLWNAQRSSFRARDVRTGRFADVDTVGSLVALLDPWLRTDVADHVVALAESAHFAGGCRYPLPSTALTSERFERRRYWRGPTWINTNWLVWLGARQAGRADLAQRLRASSLDLVSAGGYREYYDAMTGTGLGSTGFSWSAALTLDLLAADVAADVGADVPPDVGAAASARR